MTLSYLTPQQVKDTVDWNKRRNGLTFDLSLEESMLLEEIEEFWEAYTEQKGYYHVDMIDALCDTWFVYIGTRAKLVGTKATPEVTELLLFVETEMHTMYDILERQFGLHTDNLSACYQIVLDANKAKGTKKNAEGKVEKGDEWVDPKHTIAEYLKELEDRVYLDDFNFSVV